MSRTFLSATQKKVLAIAKETKWSLAILCDFKPQRRRPLPDPETKKRHPPKWVSWITTTKWFSRLLWRERECS